MSSWGYLTPLGVELTSPSDRGRHCHWLILVMPTIDLVVSSVWQRPVSTTQTPYREETGMRQVFLFLFAVWIVFCAGCSTPSEIRTEGIVAWNYRSILQDVESCQPAVSGSIRISDFKSDAPSHTPITGIGVVKLFPVLSLIPAPTWRYTNSVPATDFQSIAIYLRSNEIERLVQRELQASHIVETVTLTDQPADYELRGQVNFELGINAHYSGLGMIGQILLFPTILILPGGTDTFRCQAHFELLSLNADRVIHSKDYAAQRKRTVWIYNSFHELNGAFGRNVFPRIVEQLIDDLRALPPSAWAD